MFFKIGTFRVPFYVLCIISESYHMQMIVWLVMFVGLDKFTVTKSYSGTLRRLISIISWLASKLNVCGFSKDGQV